MAEPDFVAYFDESNGRVIIQMVASNQLSDLTSTILAYYTETELNRVRFIPFYYKNHENRA